MTTEPSSLMEYDDILIDISAREKQKSIVQLDERRFSSDSNLDSNCSERESCQEEEEEEEEQGDNGKENSVVDLHVLTEDERLLIISSWDLIQDRVASIGVSAYNELFRMSPQAIQFFPMLHGVKEGEEGKFEEIVRDHSIRILGIIGLIVRNLTKIKSTDPREFYSLYKFAFQLGEKHFRYGANPRLMGLLGLAFAQSMKDTLLEMDNCEEVEIAWKSFFSVITGWMRRGFLYIQNKGREVDKYALSLSEVLQ